MIFLYGKKLSYFLQLNKCLENENSSLKMEVSLLKEFLDAERAERTKLQDAILIRTGFSPNIPEHHSDNSNIKPIGSSRISWPALRQKLEREAYERAVMKAAPRDNGKTSVSELVKEVDKIIEEGEKSASS